MNYRASALSALAAHERCPKLLAVLRALVEEAQPLGIDRPAYQAALAAIDEAEEAELDELFGAPGDVLVDQSYSYGQATSWLHFSDVVGVHLRAPYFREYGGAHDADAVQCLDIVQASGNRITILLDRVIHPCPVQDETAPEDATAVGDDGAVLGEVAA